jgi:uncharacterized membrane protein
MDEVMIREYAKYMGGSLLLFGVLGYLVGTYSVSQLLAIDAIEERLHLLSGAVMAYVGYRSRDLEHVRDVVGVVGIVFLLIGSSGFITPTLFGMLSHGYSIFTNLAHLALGTTGIAMAWWLKEKKPRRLRRVRIST